MVKTHMFRLRGVGGRNVRDQIAFIVPFILSGSPNECWLHTCDARVIKTWRLGLRAPFVARNNCLEENVFLISLQNFLRIKGQPN